MISVAIPVAPMVAGAFAFAFVVGYFLAFDIAWFAFFTLSEHAVFALRALPIAIGISSAFLIAFQLAKNAKPEGRLRHCLYYGWIVFLVGTGAAIIPYNHAGMSVTLFLIAIAVFFYHTRPSIRTPFVAFLLGATNMMLLTVVVGVFSGSSWQWPALQPDVRAMGIKVEGQNNYVRGHVIFAGGDNVLFYEFGVGNQPGATHLYRWQNIKEIVECPTSDDCTRPARKPTKR